MLSSMNILKQPSVVFGKWVASRSRQADVAILFGADARPLSMLAMSILSITGVASRDPLFIHILLHKPRLSSASRGAHQMGTLSTAESYTRPLKNVTVRIEHHFYICIYPARSGSHTWPHF
jgi:hypothetical protein